MSHSPPSITRAVGGCRSPGSPGRKRLRAPDEQQAAAAPAATAAARAALPASSQVHQAAAPAAAAAAAKALAQQRGDADRASLRPVWVDPWVDQPGTSGGAAGAAQQLQRPAPAGHLGGRRPGSSSPPPAGHLEGSSAGSKPAAQRQLLLPAAAASRLAGLSRQLAPTGQGSRPPVAGKPRDSKRARVVQPGWRQADAGAHKTPALLPAPVAPTAAAAGAAAAPVTVRAPGAVPASPSQARPAGRRLRERLPAWGGRAPGVGGAVSAGQLGAGASSAADVLAGPSGAPAAGSTAGRRSEDAGGLSSPTNPSSSVVYESAMPSGAPSEHSMQLAALQLLRAQSGGWHWQSLPQWVPGAVRGAAGEALARPQHAPGCLLCHPR
jgi:hypothetical protein